MNTDKKLILSILLSILCSLSLHAQPWDSNLHFAVEWGYIQSVYSRHHYNYITEEGYRLDEQSSGFSFHPNGTVSLSAGVDFKDKWLLSICAAYSGVGESSHLLPLNLRLGYYPRTLQDDGIFVYASGGPGFNMQHDINKSMAWLAGAGCGYRLALTGRCSLDFILGLKAAYTYPNIQNPDGPGFVDESDIRRNKASSYALSFTVAVNI